MSGRDLRSSRVVETESWRLNVPAWVTEKSPLLCVPTIHPRGDQRVVRCAQVALDAGFRIKFIWLGTGVPAADSAVSEELMPPAGSFAARTIQIPLIAWRASRSRAVGWHIHDFYFVPVARLWHLVSRKHVVYDVHEYYSTYYSEKLPLGPRSKARVRRFLDRFQVRSAEAFGGANVVAAAMAELYRARAVPVSVSPNYPMRAPYEEIGYRPLSERTLRAIHTGTLSTAYGMKILIDLAVACHNEHIDLSIDLVDRFTSDADRREFSAYLESVGELPNLRLIDQVPSHDLPQLLSGYGIGLSMITGVGQNEIAVPTKLYEYVIMGLYVVGTDRLAQRAFMSEWGRGELYSDSDVAGMSEAIGRVIVDGSRIDDEMWAKSRSARKSLFWEDSAEVALRGLYLRLFRDRLRLGQGPGQSHGPSEGAA